MAVCEIPKWCAPTDDVMNPRHLCNFHTFQVVIISMVDSRNYNSLYRNKPQRLNQALHVKNEAVYK